MDDKNYKLALFMGNEPEIIQYAVRHQAVSSSAAE